MTHPLDEVIAEAKRALALADMNDRMYPVGAPSDRLFREKWTRILATLESEKAKTPVGLMPTAFLPTGDNLGTGVGIERRPRPHDGEWWAIKFLSQVWGRDGWEHEPLPSSRDDAFLARCRWRWDEVLVQFPLAQQTK